ncbi:MAG: TolC family protein [Muribaculaceae bacterium]|nr:TolC family protein [Muribaculaceae bacterium]
MTKLNIRIPGILLVVLLSLSVGSCKLGQKYSRPNVYVPNKFQPEIITDTFSIGDMKWWDIYTDTTLQSLIRITLQNNKELKIAEAKVKEMAARKRIDTANFFPQINGNVYTQKEALNYGGDNYKNDPEVGLKAALSWEIDLWGNLRWANDEGKAQVLESIENQRAVTISLIARVAQDYYELVALDNELSIVKQTLKARKEGVRLAKLRFEGGLTSETSYQQAQVEYARTATHIPVLERDISMMENEIAYLTGDLDFKVKRTKISKDLIGIESLPVGLPSTLLERRPDIKAAEQKLIAANAAVGVAYTNRFPRLTLTAQYGVESDEFSNLFKSPMYFLSGALLGPLFDMGKRQSAYRAQQHVYEQECYNYEKTVMNAFTETRNAIVAFNKTKDIYESMSQLEKSSKTTMELAQLQYINGVIGYIDVLDAQRSYFDAQVGLSNAIRDKQLALVRLYKALGGGW